MIITNWRNEEKEFSFVVSAKSSDLLSLQGFFMDILNEFHFMQIPMYSSGMRSQRVFIKKMHIPALRASMTRMNGLENELTSIARQILLLADGGILDTSVDTAHP
jgi:hypothetical protein